MRARGHIPVIKSVNSSWTAIAGCWNLLFEWWWGSGIYCGTGCGEYLRGDGVTRIDNEKTSSIQDD